MGYTGRGYNMKNKEIKEALLFSVLIIICCLLFVYIGKSEDKDTQNYGTQVKAKVLSVNDEDIIPSGMSPIGFQYVTVEILEGKDKGKVIEASNQLLGKMDYDSYYSEGENLLVALQYDENNTVVDARTVEHLRSPIILAVFILFVLILIIYARVIGIKALFSFIASLFIIWKILIPLLLKGVDPIQLTILGIILLGAIIIFSVAGFTKKGFTAYFGTLVGLLVTTGLTIIVGNQIGLMGMTAPYAETIVFSGFFDLNMKEIYYTAIIIGSSGAAMDIAMDVAASINELKLRRPDLSRNELIKSGLTIGRDVIGTMTTTLLLAYSGGYLTLLMLFQIRETSFEHMINMKIVVAEIMRTLIGSLGLVIVAPITAIIAGVIYSRSVAVQNSSKYEHIDGEKELNA